MKTIHKFFIHFGQTVCAILPLDAKPVHFGMQNEQPVMWVELTIPEVTPSKKRFFRVFGTGHEIPDSAVYIDTVQDGEFVWHLYEVQP